MKFIYSYQKWADDVKHIVIMSDEGVASCRLSMYKNENVQVLSDVFVRPGYRNSGFCTEMLYYVERLLDQLDRKKYTLVYIEKDCPDYIRNMCKKMNYVILTKG